MKLLLTPLLLTLPLLSACVHGLTVPDAPLPTNDFCRLVEPISYDSVNDTPETVKQVEKLNAKWLVLCDLL